MIGSTARATVIGPTRLVSICARTCSVVSSSKKPARKLPALLSSTSIPPKQSTVAAGGHDVVAGSQGRTRELDAHATTGAGDEPGLRHGLEGRSAHGAERGAV